MSRTLKDRPYWVLKNDPEMDRYPSHQHIKIVRDKVGEEPVYREVLDKDGWHWSTEVWYTRPVYSRHSEQVECDLEAPETSTMGWRDKSCHYWLEYYPNVKSHKDFKRLTNGAKRSKVRQQLHTAVRSKCLNWEDLDVYTDSKYDGRGWWD